jgi:mitochondrial inner membrane protein COX18
VQRTRDELLRKHKCTTLPTVLVPTFTQIPLFVGLSVVFNRACQRPTPLDSESFATLTSLAHTDPTMTFPVALGLLTLANVESAKWTLNPERKERELKVEKWVADKRAKGEMVIRPADAIRTGLRLVSIGRIIVGALVPGVCFFFFLFVVSIRRFKWCVFQGVLICWITSATFGLVQTWGFDWWERRRRLRLPATKPRSSPPPSAAGHLHRHRR